MRPVATPMFAFDQEFDARAFTLVNLCAKRCQQGFNVCENNRR
jgi:hypothetical protein